MTFTRRYASNLLKKGKNNEFELLDLKRQYTDVDGLAVGIYYQVLIKGTQWKKDAAGVTPLQAVERCLEKHGVTFR